MIEQGLCVSFLLAIHFSQREQSIRIDNTDAGQLLRTMLRGKSSAGSSQKKVMRFVYIQKNVQF